MDRSAIRTQIRSIILEPTAGLWSDDELNQYINDGISDLTDVALYEKFQSTDVAAGTATVTIPTDFLESQDVRWQNAVGTNYVLDELPGNYVPDDRQSVPQVYALDPAGGVLRFWPVPSEDGTLLWVYFAKLPELSLDTDVPVIDSRWHRLLVYFGVTAAMEKSQDAGAAQYAAQYGAGRAAFAIERARRIEKPVSVVNILDQGPGIVWPKPLRDLT